jgi:hypothetical protein
MLRAVSTRISGPSSLAAADPVKAFLTNARNPASLADGRMGLASSAEIGYAMTPGWQQIEIRVQQSSSDNDGVVRPDHVRSASAGERRSEPGGSSSASARLSFHDPYHGTC